MTSPPPESTETGHNTPNRILEVASELFAEHGFEKTTVRQISESAGVNVAAVNYHFSDKEALYFEVLRRAHSCANMRHPMANGPIPNMPPEDQLRAFVAVFLRRIFDSERDMVFGRLMAHEMMRPTGALDRLIDIEIRPKSEVLKAIVRRIGLVEFTPDELRRLCYSIIGQVIFYKHAAPMIARLSPELCFDEPEVAALEEHITRCSIAAIRSYRPHTPETTVP